MVLALPLRLGAAEREWQLYDNRVDSLCLWERLSLHANMVDWVALVPNVGVELTLGRTNWHKWTLGLAGRWKPSASRQGIVQRVGWTVSDLRGELRKYWHGRGRRRVFFWGVYGGAAKYDVKWLDKRHYGKALYGGLTAGTIAPLYAWPNGGNLDLEMAASIGAAYGEREARGREWILNPLLLAGLADALRIGFVYHFGTPVCDRYKKRAAVDEQFMRELDARRLREDSVRRERKLADEARRDSLFEIDYMKRLEKQRVRR